MTDADIQNKPTPVLLLLKGHPGSGKSTLAKLIASDRYFTLSDKDDSRDCLKAAEDANGPATSWDLNALSYNIMFTVAATQLSCGLSVVVDCPLSKVELYHQALNVARKYNAATAVIECRHSQPNVWKQRLEARAQQSTVPSHKPATWADLTSLIQRYNKQDEWSNNGTVEMEHYLLLDTSTKSAAEQLSEVRAFLQQHSLGQDATQNGRHISPQF